ncbi:hypothetical protein AMST5_03861 [freshwater sediment metagenome]|uniref:FecR protein domain-containing protein n=1 Tax=freshwater sediment metagenome TaxID=556182 RepID=A0AA48M2Q6_9ZZZZ
MIAPTAAVVAAEQIGVAVTVRNEVTGKIQAETVRIASGSDVFGKEIVKTSADSTAHVVMKDNTNLNVGPNSSVTLDNFVFNGDSDYKKASFGLAKGALRFASGQSDKRAYEVRTPLATIGVRGTDYSVEVGERRVPARPGKPAHTEQYSHVEVDHGTVVVCPKNSKEHPNDVDVAENDDDRRSKRRKCGCDEVHEQEAVDVTETCVYQSQFTGQTSQMACGGQCGAPMSYNAATLGSLPGLATAVIAAGAIAGGVVAGANNSNSTEDNTTLSP